MIKLNLFILLICLVMFGCQNSSKQAGQTVTVEYFASGPQLVKIPIKDSAVADSLLNRGMDVIVIEKDYVIARLGSEHAAGVQSMSLSMQTFKEEELVQRLIHLFSSLY